MAVLLSFRGRKALFRHGEWRASHRVLELRLARELEAWIGETGGPRIGSPDPELEAARAVAARAGGTGGFKLDRKSTRLNSSH